MAFKNPVVSPLTETQEKLLGQLGSLRNILTNPIKRRLSIPDDKQISTFDYMLRIAEATVGKAFIDILLKKFIDEIFSPSSDKLERAILKGIAKSLDKQGKHISNDPNETNVQWLTSNALGPFHATMQIVKALIVKQILGMIFGPKDKMSYNSSANFPVNMGNIPSNDDILDNVVAAGTMFSTSIAESNQFGDLEYNTITIKNQLEKGEVVFTISCQDIKIHLPATFDQDVDAIVQSSLNSLQGITTGGGFVQVINPSIAFEYISNHVGNETQRINTQENVNSIRKSFLQILVEKILNLIIIAIQPYLIDILNKINTSNPTLNLTIIGLLSSPFELKNLQQTDETQFDIKKTFTYTVINVLYALLLSIILKELIKEIKKLIKNAIAKKAAIRAQSKLKRLQIARKKFEDADEKLEKSKLAASALKEFNSIFNFTDNF